MDAPLLALTRRWIGSPGGPSPEIAAAENMRQLIQLRWIAVGGQLVTILAVNLGLGVPLPLAAMLGVIGLLTVANLAATFALARHRVRNIEMMLALLLDMGALTAQLYLSGGATNPFISLYLLQVVLGAILLDGWSVWVLVALTSLCYAGLSLVSIPLSFPSQVGPEVANLHALGVWISFALIGILLAQFITRITRNLRARDTYLADLRQHAAEEDGIVRMGLFASGAAHELGTPLASLSVILSDWRRIPKIASDAELVGELEEMQAEVERCKSIVTDILDSAGEPRGEAIESAAVRSFLEEVVATWRSTHTAVALDTRWDELDGAHMVTSPELRQAIWSLLDNGAEASPAGVALHAFRTGDALTISVADDGPGFAPEQLAMVGRLGQSSKGSGHGLGLFLANNVVRRLGGRLESRNRATRGAEVRLVLPLARDRLPDDLEQA
ncbi:MAG: ATP-binding protein [Sphingomicrobium sp.]